MRVHDCMIQELLQTGATKEQEVRRKYAEAGCGDEKDRLSFVSDDPQGCSRSAEERRTGNDNMRGSRIIFLL